MRKIICIVGESATGKDTLVQNLLQTKKKACKAVSYTTRPMREGEIEGVDYHFVTDKRFDELRKSEGFIEETEYLVNGNVWHYAFGNNTFNDSKSYLAVVNPRGLKAILSIPELKKDVFVIRLRCSAEARKERYFERDKKTPKKIVMKRWNARLAQDEEDFKDLARLFANTKVNNTTIYTDNLTPGEVSRTVAGLI